MNNLKSANDSLNDSNSSSDDSNVINPLILMNILKDF